MDLRTWLPLVVTVFVGLVVLRMVIGALRKSAKLMMWLVVAAAVFGLGYVWYHEQDPSSRPELPVLNIPSVEPSAP